MSTHVLMATAQRVIKRAETVRRAAPTGAIIPTLLLSRR
jgi:hypothetical protein